MPNSQRPSHSKPFLQLPGQPQNFLTKSELIAGYLQNLALPSIFNRELTTADFELWDRLLSPYSVQAIEYAFDTYGRNGSKFPLPKDIITLIDVYSSDAATSFPRTLPSGRQPLDNHWPAWWWMYNQVAMRIDAATKEKRAYIPLNTAEIEDLHRRSEEYLSGAKP